MRHEELTGQAFSSVPEPKGPPVILWTSTIPHAIRNPLIAIVDEILVENDQKRKLVDLQFFVEKQNNPAEPRWGLKPLPFIKQHGTHVRGPLRGARAATATPGTIFSGRVFLPMTLEFPREYTVPLGSRPTTLADKAVNSLINTTDVRYILRQGIITVPDVLTASLLATVAVVHFYLCKSKSIPGRSSASRSNRFAIDLVRSHGHDMVISETELMVQIDREAQESKMAQSRRRF